MKYRDTYDLIVVGGGHAGIEAALVSARSGLDTLLITLNLERVGHMPCNPAVGGPAKGHIVREVDALGGEIGKAADATYLQSRYLNTRKGPSVRALRCQTDKAEYARYMKKTLEDQAGLFMKEDTAAEVLISDEGHFEGIRTNLGLTYFAKAAVLAPGTFLRGKCHVGSRQWDAGRRGERPAVRLSESLEALGYPIRRLKTGTPPRVDRRSIDFEKLEPQKGLVPPPRFSYLSPPGSRTQLDCWILRTTEATKELIERHLQSSPMFSGQIRGQGPRYCPSIEDKIHRFPDRGTHPIFLEPEGFDTDEMYVQGLSTSMDESVQLAVLRTLPGFESVAMIRPGYAVEYDAIDARELDLTLQSTRHPGLFFAGQICGTSGYEEAAGQGFLAGLNAVLKVQEKPAFRLTRQEAYIGVMVDDLTSLGQNEPYRMFTGRAEYRLILRHDNADLRLTPKVLEMPHLSPERIERFQAKRGAIEGLEAWVQDAWVEPSPELSKALAEAELAGLEEKTRLNVVLKRQGMDLGFLAAQGIHPPGGLPEDHEAVEEVELNVKYEGYIAKQAKQIELARQFEGYVFPEDFDFQALEALSFEGRSCLQEARPSTLGQAGRVPGVRAADVAVLAQWIQRQDESPSEPSS